MKVIARSVVSVCLTIGFGVTAGASDEVIDRVSTTTAFFNPSLGQKTTIGFALSHAGKVSVSILDRDRFLIRKLEPFEGAAGQNAASWDGRDDGGTVVPNEAYNIRIELGGAAGDVYDPSENFHPVIEEPPNRVYSRVDGVLRYELSRPSRVHAQAGQATVDPQTKQQEGLVLKTIVDRQPRSAGGVVENWNGFDESGKIYVADLPHFVVAVFATSLPENAIITVGNRKKTFLSYARSHRPAEKQRVRAFSGEGHEHHTGLNEFEDHSPTLEIRSTPPAANGIVHVEAGHDLQLRLTLDNDRGPYFLKQPNDFDVYLGERSVVHRAAPSHPATVTIPARLLTPGEHVVAVNWGSKLGPVAVNALRVIVGGGGAQGKGNPP